MINAKVLIAGGAAVLLVSGSAFAQMTPDAAAPAAKPAMAHHHKMAHHMAKESMGEYAPPAQPIPYADLAKYRGDEAKGEPMKMHKHMMHKKMDTKTDAMAPKS
jgi:hypothetical protein